MYSVAPYPPGTRVAPAVTFVAYTSIDSLGSFRETAYIHNRTAIGICMMREEELGQHSSPLNVLCVIWVLSVIE